ncbi:MAG: hypothetical protein EXS38_12190 [Opitutus sp.]|nr:hypothetical protein [Opitutus sp.]
MAGTSGGLTQIGQFDFFAGTKNSWFNHENRPLPEPSTNGAVLFSVGPGLLGWSRFRYRHKG